MILHSQLCCYAAMRFPSKMWFLVWYSGTVVGDTVQSRSCSKNLSFLRNNVVAGFEVVQRTCFLLCKCQSCNNSVVSPELFQMDFSRVVGILNHSYFYSLILFVFYVNLGYCTWWHSIQYRILFLVSPSYWVFLVVCKGPSTIYLILPLGTGSGPCVNTQEKNGLQFRCLSIPLDALAHWYSQKYHFSNP